MKLVRELGSLRTKTKAKIIRQSIVKALEEGFRVVDWSIQDDHIHLNVEAASSVVLSRRMQGLSIRIARGLNRQADRTGKVFADRYHVRVLKTPREVRNARAYVMLNARKHAAQRGRSMRHDWVDPYSSWAWFDGWRDCPREPLREARAGPEAERCCAEPTTWLMRKGWRRHGLIRIDEVPGGRLS